MWSGGQNLSLSLEGESLCDRSHDVLAPAHLYVCGLVVIVCSDSFLRVRHILALHREWLIQKDLPRHPYTGTPRPGQDPSGGGQEQPPHVGLPLEDADGGFHMVPYCAALVGSQNRRSPRPLPGRTAEAEASGFNSRSLVNHVDQVSAVNFSFKWIGGPGNGIRTDDF